MNPTEAGNENSDSFTSCSNISVNSRSSQQPLITQSFSEIVSFNGIIFSNFIYFFLL